MIFKSRMTFSRYFSLKSKLFQNSLNESRNATRMLPVALQQKNGELMNMNISVWEPHYSSLPLDTSPVIIALHGAPGSWQDFQEMGEEFAKKGTRFIVPEFPGFGGSSLSKEDIYKLEHSTESKFEILKAIISALGLTRIDVCIGHSAGSWIAYKTCADLEMVKSGVFINGLGARPHRALRPYWGVKLAAWCLRNKVTHPVAYRMLPVLYKIVGFRVTDTSPLQAAVERVATSGLDNMSRYAETIKGREIPVLFAWAENDYIVETEISKEMAKMTGVRESEIIHIDRENNKKISTQPKDIKIFRRALSFERGGHLIQKKHLNEIVDNIEQMMKYIQK